MRYKMTSETVKGPVRESGVCRCCGSVKRCRVLTAQYMFEGRCEVYSEMFVDCFGLLLSNQDGTKENCLICATCVTRLRDAYSFKMQVLSCEEKLFQSISHVQIEIKMESDVENVKTDLNVKPFENSVKQELQSSYNEERNPLETNDIDDQTLKDLLLHEMQVTKEKLRKMQEREDMAEEPLPSTTFEEEQEIKLPETILSIRRPPDVTKMLQIAKMDKKAAKNTETLVEYSYVCPFENIFSDLICVYCREVFSVPEELIEHTKLHDPASYKEKRNQKKTPLIDITRIDCRLCNTNIDSVESFIKHITTKHNKVYYPVKDTFIKFKLKQNCLECVECGSAFNFFFVLKRHMAEHYGNHLCDLCGMHFFNEPQLRRHYERKHTNEPRKCTECNQICKNIDYLKAHINRSHRKEELFECHKCHERFPTYSEKSRHISSVHSKGRTFKCTTCNSTFNDICVWREHKRVHAKNLKIQQARLTSKDEILLCPHCPKICMNKAGLRMHVKKVHAKIKLS